MKKNTLFPSVFPIAMFEVKTDNDLRGLVIFNNINGNC